MGPQAQPHPPRPCARGSACPARRWPPGALPAEHWPRPRVTVEALEELGRRKWTSWRRPRRHSRAASESAIPPISAGAGWLSPMRAGRFGPRGPRTGASPGSRCWALRQGCTVEPGGSTTSSRPIAQRCERCSSMGSRGSSRREPAPSAATTSTRALGPTCPRALRLPAHGPRAAVRRAFPVAGSR